MKKVLVLVLVVLMLVAAFAGCQKADAPTADAPAADAPADAPAADAPADAPAEKAAWKIGFSNPTMDTTLGSAMAVVYETACEELGVEGQVFNADNNQEKQNADIEDMISVGYDAIVVWPLTAEGAVPGIKYANEAGIPIFTVDRSVTADMGAEAISHISVDQTEIGRMAGRAFLEGLEEKFPDAEEWIVLELEGVPGASSTIERSNGINEIISQDPRIKKLPNLAANYDTSMAVSVTEDVLTAHPELMGIVAANDMMIEGSLQALTNFNKVGDVLLVGADGQRSTAEKVRDGLVFATPTTTPLMASYALQAAVDYLEGKEVDKLIIAPSQVVTKENAEEYLASDLCW